MITRTPGPWAIYTVRNAAGQRLAAYRARSPAESIQRLCDDQMQTASFFKRQIATGLDKLTAKIEVAI